MPREFRLPELAESVVEGEIVQWLVPEGEAVEEDQAIVEVMTDKATVELPSPYAGVLQKHLVQEGDVVPVNAPIALFGDAAAAEAEQAKPDDDSEPAATGAGDGAAAEGAAEDEGDALSLFKASGDVDQGPVFQVRRERAEEPTPAAKDRPTGPYGRVLAVPAARKLARELDVDLSDVEGSGPNGRIRVEDVRAYADGATRKAPTAPSGRGPAVPREPTRYQTPEGYGDLEERLPMRGLRRAISNQMVASHLQTVRALHVDEADVTRLVDLRARLKPRAAERDVKLSYLPFIMKAIVSALKAYPMVNASYDEEAGEIVRKRYYNLGMAVATDQGLVVPVVKDVDQRSVLEIAAEVQRLAAAAREGKLAPDDMRGGTFSITNIGTVGGLFSFPIINVPEAAILGVHSIKKRPVVLEDDSIVARWMLYLSLSFDHRLVDGAEGAQFTSHIIDLLEEPDALMLDL